VARTPYLTPSGPDAVDVQASPGQVTIDEVLDLTATIDDTRYNNSQGTEPTQTIVAAEYYIDVPPWDTEGNPVAHPMTPVDASFDSGVEVVEASVATGGLAYGRHIVFVRGRDADGNWGPIGAAFFELSWEVQGTATGTVVDVGSGAPLSGLVYADELGAGASTEPVSGAYFLGLPVGTWDLRASVADYEDQIAVVEIEQGGVTFQDFVMIPADDDNDGVINLQDCAPQNPDAWSEPSAALDLRVSTSADDNLTWTAPGQPGTNLVKYDVLRADGPDGFQDATCVATDQPETHATDEETPGPGEAFHYLVRSRNACGTNLGADSDGGSRSGEACSGTGGPGGGAFVR